MKKWIRNSLIILGITLVVEIQVICCLLSPHHREFIRTMFWEFPKVLVQAWIPGL